MHKHLRRLDRLWIDSPIYFLTTCTQRRRQVLTSKPVAAILIDEFRQAPARHGWIVGSYVIMPEHVHFFCAPERDAKPLSYFIREWKSWTSRRISAGLPRPATAATGLWQREFFDHILRSDESYGEKWNCVRDNPVRAGLATCAEHWPYFGTLEYFQLAR